MIVVRPARPEDLEQLVAHNLAMAHETEGLALDPATLREGLQAVVDGRVDAFQRVAELGSRTVGSLMITREWSDWRNRHVWWFQSVYVEPAHRGQGVFRALYGAVEAEARAAGAGGLRLYVERRNVRAQAVYRALGMTDEHYATFERMFP